MPTKEISDPKEWDRLIKAHKAVQVQNLLGLPKNLDRRAIWLETDNFGYLFSPRNGEGKRSILAKH